MLEIIGTFLHNLCLAIIYVFYVCYLAPTLTNLFYYVIELIENQSGSTKPVPSILI